MLNGYKALTVSEESGSLHEACASDSVVGE